MDRQPVEPSSNFRGIPMAPIFIVAALWGGAGLLYVLWLAGRLAAFLTGTHATGPHFGSTFLNDVAHGQWSTAWPHTNHAVVAVIFVAAVVVVAAAPVGGWLYYQAHKPRATDPLPSLGSRRDVHRLTLPAVTQRAKRLQPRLADVRASQIEPAQAGVLLGTHRLPGGRSGAKLYASTEDVILAIMAPRGGKTTSLTGPGTLAFPGPVVATSNKVDIWTTTRDHRARRGTTWLFDPQHITHQPQQWWWNPLAAVTSFEDAHRFAGHFIAEISAGKSADDFWIKAAHDLLTGLILAAASGDLTLANVQAWLSSPASVEPRLLLEQHNFDAAALAFDGRQHGAEETRDGIYETARAAAMCLSDPNIMKWVTPPTVYRPLPAFDVTALATSTDTLYLLSKDGAGAAAPLVAGLVDQVMREAVFEAEANGGRLDPPLLIALDEAANICKIKDLPQLVSHFGSRGVIVETILQSYPQGEQVWGQHGMAALWSASTIKIIGRGIDDPKFAEDISRLIGSHDVAVGSRTRSDRGGFSYQTSTHQRRIMEASDVRELAENTALLFANGVAPVIINLAPWYTGPEADLINSQIGAATAEITAQARTAQDARKQLIRSRMDRVQRS